MPRKSIATLTGSADRVQEAVEDFKILSELKYELAKEAYNYQDEQTREVIDQIQHTLRVHAKSIIDVQLDPPVGKIVPVRIEQKYVDYNLLYIAMDILKNLALFDIKVAGYQFPPSLCVKCEAQIEQREIATRRKRA